MSLISALIKFRINIKINSFRTAADISCQQGPLYSSNGDIHGNMTSDSTQKLAKRLTQIIQRLYTGEQLQRAALAQEFNVSERTIFRDLERLDQWVHSNADGGYQLKSHLQPRLQLKQLEAVMSLLDIQEQLPGDTLRKLTQWADAPGDEQSYLFRGPFPEMEGIKRQDFEKLDEAVRTRHICDLRHRGKARTVAPYKLINQQGIWYLAATEAGKLKAFALSQCSNVLHTTEQFAPSADLMAEIEHNDGIWFGPKTRITLSVSGLAMEYFKRRQQVPQQTLLREHSSYLEVSTEVSHPEQLLPTLRYWIPHVRIMDNPAFTKALNASLHQYLQDQADTESEDGASVLPQTTA